MNENTIPDTEGTIKLNPQNVAAAERSNAVSEMLLAQQALEYDSLLQLQGYDPERDHELSKAEISQEALDRDPYTSQYEGNDFYFPYVNILEEHIRYTFLADMPEIKTPGFVRMTDVQEGQTEWLWAPFLPTGSVSIVVGDPGIGKTTVLLAIAANTTRGTGGLKLGEVIYLTTENSISKDIKPRLSKMGADPDKIITSSDDAPIISIDDPRFASIIEEQKPRMIILDPVQSFMGPKASMNNVQHVRPFMTKLTEIAEKYNCAVVLVAHMAKSRTKGAASTLGSVDFIAAARTVLRVGANPDDPDERAITIVKSNLTETGQSYGFTIGMNGEYIWLPDVKLTAADMDRAPEKVKKGKPSRPRDLCMETIKNLLADGPMLTTELEEKIIEAIGVSVSTIDRARKELGVIAERDNEFQGQWYCSLPS